MNNKYRLNRKEIEQYLASREEEFLSGHDTGQGWERLQRRIARRRKKRVITRLAYMAVCFIALGGFSVWLLQEKEQQTLALQETISASADDFPEKGESKAILFLSNGEKINLDQNHSLTDKKDSALFTNDCQEGILTYQKTADAKPVQEYNTLVIPKGG